MYLFIQKPFYQALFFLMLTPVVIFLFQPKSADRAWVIAACTFALFLIANAVMLWFSHRPWHYFFVSLGFSVGYLLLVALAMQGVIRMMNLKGAEESAMAFLVWIYHPFALLLVMFAKWIAHKWF